MTLLPTFRQVLELVGKLLNNIDKCIIRNALTKFGRVFPLLMLAVITAGCAAAMVGGTAVGVYQVSKDEREAGVVASDASITTAIKSRFAADPVVSVFEIGVRSWEGTVTLTGAVGSFRARDTAAEIAAGTNGVKAVNNLIEVEDRSRGQ